MMRRGIFILFMTLFLSCVPMQEDKTKTQWQYFYDLGMSSYVAKNYSEAIANFFRATQLAPSEPKVWNALGLAYMEVQEYQKAESAFQRALQVDRNYTEAKLNLGVLYYRQKDYEKALKVLKEVLQDEAFPQKHLAFYFLAKVYQALDRKEEYVKNLNRAIAYNPMFVDAQLELAQAYETEGNYASAREVYHRLIDNGLINPAIHLSLAEVEYKLGNYSLAKDYIKRVIEDRQTTPQLKARAYDLLTLVLVAEQKRSISPGAPPPPAEKPPRSAPLAEHTQESYQTPQKLFRIQLGAFSSQTSAKSWKERLERDFNLRDITIIESSGVYKVLYGRFESRDQAIRELQRLRNMNIYGFVVQE